MRLLLGPLVLEVEGVTRDAFSGLEGLLASFETERDAHVQIEVSVLGERLRHWRDQGSVTFKADPTRNALFVRVVDWEAEFLLDERRTVLVLRDAWGPALDQFLKSAAQVWLPACGLGLAFHASAVWFEGRGIVFTARAETGKTTVAQALKERGAEVITEEMACLALGDAWTLHTLPQRERSSLQIQRPVAVPLHQIYALRQADHDEVERMGQGAALAALLRTVAIGVRDPLMINTAHTLCERLAAEVDVRSLRFRRGTGFIDVLRGDLGLI